MESGQSSCSAAPALLEAACQPGANAPAAECSLTHLPSIHLLGAVWLRGVGQAFSSDAAQARARTVKVSVSGCHAKPSLGPAAAKKNPL